MSQTLVEEFLCTWETCLRNVFVNATKYTQLLSKQLFFSYYLDISQLSYRISESYCCFNSEYSTFYNLHCLREHLNVCKYLPIITVGVVNFQAIGHHRFILYPIITSISLAKRWAPQNQPTAITSKNARKTRDIPPDCHTYRFRMYPPLQDKHKQNQTIIFIIDPVDSR